MRRVPPRSSIHAMTRAPLTCSAHLHPGRLRGPRCRDTRAPVPDADTAQIRAFMATPPFNEAIWGVLATDVETGRELFSADPRHERLARAHRDQAARPRAGAREARHRPRARGRWEDTRAEGIEHGRLHHREKRPATCVRADGQRRWRGRCADRWPNSRPAPRACRRQRCTRPRRGRVPAAGRASR